jgi:hypothetical protein
LRRGWTRLLAGVSAIPTAAMLVAAVVSAQHPFAATGKRFNETMLAGLRPESDAISKAERLYKGYMRQSTELSWLAVCSKELLAIGADSDHKIQTIRVSAAPWISGDCNKHRPTPWRTGRGLRIGSPVPLAIQLYGEPDSRSPSSQNGQRLELLYYAFDWAGPDVPQVMEVLCTVEPDGKPGRVVEITLAASSL